MKQYFGTALSLFGLFLCLCESDSLILYAACGCFGVMLMASGAGIAGAYITKGDKIHE
jgi:hypothetical protein